MIWLNSLILNITSPHQASSKNQFLTTSAQTLWSDSVPRFVSSTSSIGTHQYANSYWFLLASFPFSITISSAVTSVCEVCFSASAPSWTQFGRGAPPGPSSWEAISLTWLLRRVRAPLGGVQGGRSTLCTSCWWSSATWYGNANAPFGSRGLSWWIDYVSAAFHKPRSCAFRVCLWEIYRFWFAARGFLEPF